MLAGGALWANLGASVERVGLGFLTGLLLAIVLGTLVGSSRLAERLIDPTLQGIRAVPSLAWVPLILVWLGIGENRRL